MRVMQILDGTQRNSQPAAQAHMWPCRGLNGQNWPMRAFPARVWQRARGPTQVYDQRISTLKHLENCVSSGPNACVEANSGA